MSLVTGGRARLNLCLWACTDRRLSASQPEWAVCAVLWPNGSAHEFIESAVEGHRDRPKGAPLLFQMRRGARKPGGKPLAVGERYH